MNDIIHVLEEQLPRYVLDPKCCLLQGIWSRLVQAQLVACQPLLQIMQVHRQLLQRRTGFALEVHLQSLVAQV
jgi:hypothetical protein